MLTLVAVYLDLRDLQSARVWRWLRLLDSRVAEAVEIRPFCVAVEDPWECESPPLDLELLMLLEQARQHGPESVMACVEAAFQRLAPLQENAHAELVAWLQVGVAAGLPLREYDLEMEELRAEVGYWQAEARQDHGVVRPPTLLFDDGTTVFVQLDRDIPDAGEAKAFLELVRAKVAAVGSGSVAH